MHCKSRLECQTPKSLVIKIANIGMCTYAEFAIRMPCIVSPSYDGHRLSENEWTPKICLMQITNMLCIPQIYDSPPLPLPPNWAQTALATGDCLGCFGGHVLLVQVARRTFGPMVM